MEDHFVPIYDWMRELGLKPTELLTFAVVYSFGKDGDWFTGSASYLGKWMGLSHRHSIYAVLTSLVEKELLEKRERYEKGQKLCDYRPGRKASRGGRKPTTGCAETDPGPRTETDHHYIRPDKIRDKYIVKISLDEFKKTHR